MKKTTNEKLYVGKFKRAVLNAVMDFEAAETEEHRNTTRNEANKKARLIMAKQYGLILTPDGPCTRDAGFR